MLKGMSAFVRVVRAWTVEICCGPASVFCFVEKPDAGGDDFLAKLQRQRSDASP
jgi:hypothetical protein